ncbi:MAG: undecaprenyl-diphosphatase UppP [Patescibacteria group bacterium]
MDWLDALILGGLQGVTEFLPISSSGHLVLVEEWLNLDIATLKSFDVMLHMGTLLAIFIYFWKDIKEMILALGRFFTGKLKFSEYPAKLILFLIIGTIPAVILGVFGDFLDENFRNVKSIAILMLAVAGVFMLAEYFYDKKPKKEEKVQTWKQALIIGLAQAMALIPGVSRSGATISAGLFQGIERSGAAKFSFLLGIPAMIGAAILTGLKSSEGGAAIDALPLVIGFISSFTFGILSVSFLMKFLKKYSLRTFAAYRVLLALVLFWVYFL